MESLRHNLDLDPQALQVTTTNASNIIQKIVSSYDSTIGAGQVGKAGRGVPANFRRTEPGPTGLIYGRIQSGKTRAMITSSAMAFDNGFRIVVVMTSNINDLVSQTHLDFSRDLVGVRVFTKDDELDEHVENAELELTSPEGRILLITSKGGKSLGNILDFLNAIDAKRYPILIFDDEGDQASLDTNTYKRSSSGNLTLEKSPINKLIARLRASFPACVYVSVTGTPQAVLLQAASSDNRPSFIEMLPAGNGYIGGESFFSTAEPEENPDHLVTIISNFDKSRLLSTRAAFPEGLRDAILFYLLAAAAAKQNLGLPKNGYQFLCHPSLKNNEQDQAKKRIFKYLTEVRRILAGHTDTLDIGPALHEQHRKLKLQLGVNKTPSLASLKSIIEAELKREKILVINASNNKRRGIEYGPGFNFLIGGNTLGRGIAIPNLLVTYYVRQAVTSQMDTMHQHARMFGYRQSTLPYTQLFTTRPLYYRFRDIYTSDQALRLFIEGHMNNDPNTFPVDTSIGLTPTRKGVLDVDTVEAIAPGMQVYPNRMRLPQTQKSMRSIRDLLFLHFKIKKGDRALLADRAKKGGVLISIDDANEILSLIKTSSTNSWHDRSIQAVLTKLSQRLGSKVLLKYRPAVRAIHEDGLISSGTLSGTEQNEGRGEQHTTLWIMDVTPRPRQGLPALSPFIFPTIVVPNRLPSVFVFSKK